ncbi:glucarate dehydratase family protein [Streptomyces fuscichromogenes]|uniref:glucarate dehydratase family protein n=1 Tax=Streptomyces fuscichromogenes TaxID=1324013 RepID=UPI0037FF8B8A
MSDVRIKDLVVTPIAFRDPPLLNADGVHEPWALRSVIQLVTEDGVTGLGESFGDVAHLERLAALRPHLAGTSVYALGELYAKAAELFDHAGGGISSFDLGRVHSAVEVACLDVQGKLAGRPVSDLLGGAVRAEVPFSAYLFYKWAGHPGAEPDEWGAALDPQGVVDQARRMIDRYGFKSVKLKGGVFPPDQEIAAIRALRDAFPDHPLRLDPNVAWTAQTSLWVAEELDGVVEYLEDPVRGIPGMAEVAAKTPMPLATNMCVVAFDHIPPAVAQGAVQVILGDHHYWGGLTRTRHLGTICETFGIGMSMHSNSHLGISLAAMTHLAAATPNLTYACDTHYPWSAQDDVVVPGALEFTDGSLRVPTGPGLGVELDQDVLARLHENYLTCGLRRRDDTGYMLRVNPDFKAELPRW